jgi:hypothetical protein
MPGRFDKFIHEENIRDLGKQIEVETDQARLALLRSLLKEEQTRPGFSSARQKPD